MLTKLKDNRELQHFLQDGQEVKETNNNNDDDDNDNEMKQ